MKVKLTMTALVYKVADSSFKDPKGNDVKFYKAHCEQGNDVASISCSEDCSSKIRPMKENNLLCEYDTESKKLRIVDVVGRVME